MITESTIGELIETLIDYRGKTPAKSESGVPLITAKVIKGGTILVDRREYIAESSYDSWMRRGLPQSGDILITTEAPLGEVARVGSNARIALAQRVILLRPNAKRVDPSFLFHYLRSPQAQASLRRRASGTTVSGIRQPELKAVEIWLPPERAQKCIGAVLDAVEDLIENNRQRVKVLEEMARTTYREWFVKFRYPGHEDVPLVDSALGPIPKGWSVSTCGAELKFIGGGTPSKAVSSYWDEGTVAWYTPTDLTKTGWRYSAAPELRITELGVAKSSARVFPAGSVMMTSRATLGVLAIATTNATTNQGFIVIMPDERWSPGYIYEWLDSKAVELASLSTGTTFREITKGSFKNFPFVVPDRLLLDKYRATTEPIEQQVGVLEQQIRNLTNLRDVLLPKLVTGQIDISSLDFDALLEGEIA
jgi:type I restriction enzyme S subunit